MCQTSLSIRDRSPVQPGRFSPPVPADMGPARRCLFGRRRAGGPVKLVKLPGYRPVVKLQERPLSGFPPASLMLLEMVAVYFVLAARVTFGFSVATWLVAL